MKKLKVLFCVFLVVLKTCDISAGDFDECLGLYRAQITPSEDESLLLLVKSYYVKMEKVNEFIAISDRMGFKVRLISDFCPEYGARIADELYNIYKQHIINLGVKNIYSYGDKTMANEKTYRNLFFVGTAAKHNTSNPCINVDSVVKGNQCIEKHLYSYTDVDENYEMNSSDTFVDNSGDTSLKVVSRSIQNYKQLFELVENFDLDEPVARRKYFSLPNSLLNPIQAYSVLLCTGDIEVRRSFIESNIPIIKTKDCNKIEYSPYYLAVIAPKPIESEELVKIPFLFYNTSLLPTEVKDIYPNSLVLYENYFKSLNIALMRFIESRFWRRISIVSDDTPNSEAFKLEFIDSVKEKGLLYMSKQCSTEICFEKALNSLRVALTTIIVANVEEKNAAALMNAARNTKMTADHGFLWIWRDWPFGLKESKKIKEEMLTISLEPVKPNWGAPMGYSSIIKGVVMIEKAANNMNQSEWEDKYDKGQLYRMFSRRIQEQQLRNCYAEIRGRSSATNREIVTMKVDGNETILISDNGYNIDDYPTRCTYKSNSYQNPCQDMYLVFIMLVIFVFMICFLALIMFFSRLRSRLYGCAAYNNIK